MAIAYFNMVHTELKAVTEILALKVNGILATDISSPGFYPGFLKNPYSDTQPNFGYEWYLSI